MKKLLLLFFVTCNYFAVAQTISGTVTAAKSKAPIAYVNIGIAGKNIGTVSGEDGKFELTVPPEFENDTLLFSCIGYRSSVIKISDLRQSGPADIVLREKIQDLKEIVIRPKVFKEKLLGIATDNKFINAGFEKNQLGYEMGIWMDVKKSAYLTKIDLNIATCSYDTVFYRINIYRAKSNTDFENVLDEPIYIKLPKDKVKDKITIDLKPYELVVDGDFLVTVELVKDLGEGSLYFCARLKDKTYYRKTSQASWETAPVGISISVLADVEK